MLAFLRYYLIKAAHAKKLTHHSAQSTRFSPRPKLSWAVYTTLVSGEWTRS